jgi:hypothetical protein
MVRMAAVDNECAARVSRLLDQMNDSQRGVS